VISALVFIVRTVSDLVVLVLLLRFWLPWFRADFRNPVAQAILRVTSPLVVPVRRFVPSIGKLDTATVIVMFAIRYLTNWILLLIIALGTGMASIGWTASTLSIALVSVFDLATLSVGLFLIVIFVSIVLSWIAPTTYNPATAFVRTIAEPLLRPFRRLIPPLGGIDISPVVPMILLGALRILLMQWRQYLM
jgi:YggT family protein